MSNNKIMGTMLGMPSPRADWNETNPLKGSFIRNKPEIGNFSELTTTNKTSIVAAINEINADCDGRLQQCDLRNEETNHRMDTIENDVGDIETALDGIIAIQNALLGVSE